MIINHLATNSTNFEIKTTLSTYREEIHRLNAHHRWARFGNDLLSGFRADRAINKQEWEFLPDNLSMDFAVEARKDTAQQPIPSTTVYPQEPRYIKLVDSTFYLISPKEVVMAADADKENSQTGTTIADVISPFVAATGILVIVILLSLTEWRRKKDFWWIDTALLILTGLPGLILPCHGVLATPHRTDQFPDTHPQPAKPHLRMERHQEDASAPCALVLQRMGSTHRRGTFPADMAGTTLRAWSFWHYLCS